MKEDLEAIADKLGAEISMDTEHFRNCSEDHFMASLGNIHTDWNWTEGAAKRELVTKLREIISPSPTITASELVEKLKEIDADEATIEYLENLIEESLLLKPLDKDKASIWSKLARAFVEYEKNLRKKAPLYETYSAGAHKILEIIEGEK